MRQTPSPGRPTSLVPLFFGPPSRRLYGVWHHPTERARRSGVVLCPPFGPEYASSLAALRALGGALAAAGFPTLRLDYTGTGDSAGELVPDELDVWRDDILTAVAELMRRSGVTAVALVGLRLGATLALHAAEDGVAVHRVVAWEPVIDGGDHLRDLDARHLARLHAVKAEYGSAPFETVGKEILGIRTPPSFRESMASLSIPELMARRRRQPSILELRERAEEHGEIAALMDGALERRVIVGPRVWAHDVGISQASVPSESIRQVVEWLVRTDE